MTDGAVPEDLSWDGDPKFTSTDRHGRVRVAR